MSELDAVADHIALDKPGAARAFVQKVFHKVDLLKRFPQLGTRPSEIRGMLYRQLWVPPCRIFYRLHKRQIFIVSVIRAEKELKENFLK